MSRCVPLKLTARANRYIRLLARAKLAEWQKKKKNKKKNPEKREKVGLSFTSRLGFAACPINCFDVEF